MSRSAPFTVMQSFRNPRATTNPYITMLDRALADELGSGHLRFSWLRALFGRYDVFHWHWPEAKLQGTSWWKSAGQAPPGRGHRAAAPARPRGGRAHRAQCAPS